MDHIGHLNRAIDYIEANLTQALAIEWVAATVGYSRFHFDRLFLATIGDTPASYLRKRRLTEAAREIVASNRSLLELALDYQFQSQEAFTRAFKRMFGVSPGVYRRRRRLARPFYRITVRPQKIFTVNGGQQAAKLILPRQGIALVRPPSALIGLQQEIFHAYRFAPTQFYLALGRANTFRRR